MDNKEVSNVLTLTSAETRVNPNVVDTLADLLRRAQNGSVTAIAVALTTSDGAVNTLWEASPRRTHNDVTLLGGVVLLTHRLSVSIEAGSYDVETPD